MPRDVKTPDVAVGLMSVDMADKVVAKRKRHQYIVSPRDRKSRRINIKISYLEKCSMDSWGLICSFLSAKEHIAFSSVSTECKKIARLQGSWCSNLGRVSPVLSSTLRSGDWWTTMKNV